MSDDAKTSNSFIKFDGTIPTWGVLLLVFGTVAYFWNNDQDLIKRMTVVEVKVEDAKQKTNEIATIASDVKVTKEILNRLEKQLTMPPIGIVPVTPR